MKRLEQDYRDVLDSLRFSKETKERMMKNITEQKEHNPAKRRGVRPLRAGLIAAALAVGCVLSIAAGLPAQVYNFVSGGSVAVTFAGDDVIDESTDETSGEWNEPIVLEDGKLWFVNGEERTDITGLIDGDTPYIYEHTDPATGNKGYVILGGTVDDFGWAEFVQLDNGDLDYSRLMGNGSFDCFATLDGKRLRMSDIPEDQIEQLNITFETVCRPWLQAALDQLGLDL
ncbi:MAG: hypothetical protein K2M42_11725 [Oscillospiraceae bacterium]|nr:hypothetical protein [Oscillospiraceae bacterium]